MGSGRMFLTLIGPALLVAAVLLGVASAAGSLVRARAADQQQCAENFPATRDAANPLALPGSPGSNPLSGARFFVDGPAHGDAAGGIARLLGMNPARLPASLSWPSFRQQLDRGSLKHRLDGHRGLARKVHALEKIAQQPQVQRLSGYSGGGGPGSVFLQTQKLLCKNSTADPGTIPILNTYFLHPAAGTCPSPGALSAASPAFRRRVDELVASVGRRPAVFLLETDALGSSSCIKRAGSLPMWESYLSYEIAKVAALPHSVACVEGGYSDANSVAYTAGALNRIGVQRIRGFYTNDTHHNWTINEVRWGRLVSKRTHGAHFVVNTAVNGRGPQLNRHSSRQVVENLCNPPQPGPGPSRHDSDRLRGGRCLDLDVDPGQEQRLRRRSSRRRLLAQAGDRTGLSGRQPARPARSQPPVLTRLAAR